MNKVTEMYNSLMAKAVAEIDLISEPHDKVNAIAGLLTALAETGATEKAHLLVYEETKEKKTRAKAEKKAEKKEESVEEKAEEKAENTPKVEAPAVVAPVPPTPPAPVATESASTTTAEAPAQPKEEAKPEQPAAEAPRALTSAEVANTWTPEMVTLYKDTLTEMNGFLQPALTGGYITMDWLSERLATASNNTIMKFENIQSVPPRLVKLFWSLVKQDWAIRKAEIEAAYAAQQAAQA